MKCSEKLRIVQNLDLNISEKMENPTKGLQDQEIIARIAQAEDSDYFGASSLARFHRMSHATFLRLVRMADIKGVPMARGTKYMKGDVANIRETVKQVQ